MSSPAVTCPANRPTVICVTPIRNESWILDRFLQCASLWADHIIIADQQSTDASREIACRHPKVTLIENRSPAYDEAARQKLLLDAARRIEGRRLIIALDADEILTANWMDSAEWKGVLQAAPGTIIRFQWVNVRPDMETGWIPPEDLPFGFLDDGGEHSGHVIHSTRIPLPAGAPSLVLRDIKVLHYQYTDWQRMRSKQRWYQCWEVVNHPKKRPTQIYRQYHHMDAVRLDQVRPLNPRWLEGYVERGIDMTSVRQESRYWWDGEILDLLERYGAARFRKTDIWDVDYTQLGRLHGKESHESSLRDPRSPLHRLIHTWLRATQPEAGRWRIRILQKLLQVVGW